MQPTNAALLSLRDAYQDDLRAELAYMDRFPERFPDQLARATRRVEILRGLSAERRRTRGIADMNALDAALLELPEAPC